MIDLEPYVPRLGRSAPRGFSSVPAALVFADVSGYTRLTERLSVLGRVGAEVIAGVVNECFTRLIHEVHAAGGEVLRFGGDALFIAITGPDRVRRAALTAVRMQRALRTLESIEVPGGRVRLKMSVGLEAGELWLRRCEGTWAEVVPVGPTVARVLRAEALAEAGEVVVGPTAMAELNGLVDDRCRLRAAAVIRFVQAELAERSSGGDGFDVLEMVPPALRSVLVDGAIPEHRAISVAFVTIPGCHGDAPRDRRRVGALLDRSFAAIDDAAARFGVVPIGTDVSSDGVKFILATGVPTATEDDEERLALAARSIVERVPSSSVGLHSGVVFCGDVGHPQRRTFTTMGDAVNLSARLMGRARPGTVVASAAIVDVLGDRFDVTWLDPFAVKGKRALQRAAELGAPTPTASEPTSRTPLHGRGHEVRELRAMRERPGLVEVIGPAGMGASRLVAEALADGDAPITVFAEVADRGTPFATARRVVLRLGGVWPAASSVDPIGLASAVAAEIGRVSAGGATLVVERTHHADEASLATFRALAVVLPETGGRVTVVGREPVAGGRCLRLGPLDDVDIRAIAIDASQRPLSDAELERIVARASGNPRFAEQVGRLASVADDLPVSLEALATARLDRLPRRTRELIREIAVVGPDVDRHEVASILGRSIGELDLAIAAASELMRVENHRIRFLDDTVADVAASGLPVGRRRTLHAAVVARITHRADMPAAQVAHHCHEAGDDAGTYRWAAQASREAMEGGASASAVVQARRALDAGVRLGRPRGELRTLAAFAAEAAIAAGQGALADRLFAQAIAAADQPAVRVDLLVRRARLARREMRISAAAALLGRARREATGRGALSVEVESCFLALRAGRDGEALRRAAQAAGSARRRRWFDLEVWAMFIVEELRSNGAIDSWEPAATALLRAAHRSGDATLVARACTNVALSYDNRGVWDRADELYAQAATEFSRGGEVLLHEVAKRNRASIQLELGDVDAVAQGLRDSVRIFAAAGAQDDVDVTAVMLGRADARRGGRASTTAARLRPCVERLAAGGATDVADFQALGLAEVQLLAGDIASALTELEGLLTRASGYGDGHLLPISCHRLLAMAHWAAGRSDLARSHLDAARLLSSGHEVPSEELMILWAQAQIEGSLSPDDTERAEELSLGLRAVSAMRLNVVDQRLARVPPGPTVSIT